MIKETIMNLRRKNLFLLILALFLLAACTLPEVTPVIETVPTENPSFIPTEAMIATPTAAPTLAAIEITARDADRLAVANRSAVNNVQQIQWADDNLHLLVASQTSDADGNQRFGVTNLGVPDLAPTGIFSTQNARIADMSSDGSKALLVALESNSFSIIDLGNANTVVWSVSPDFMVNSASFSRDGKTIAVSKMDSWEVVLYSAEDGSEVRTLTGFETAAPVYDARFMQSPQWMVWHARGTIQLQEVQSGVMGPVMGHEDFVTAFTLTKDGTILASAAMVTQDGSPSPAVILWDATSGTQLKVLILDEPAYCMAFSPNSTMLAVGSNSTVQIWDVTSGALLVSLEGHAGAVSTLAFSPDGKYLASAGQDNQLYLWQVSE